jgi:AcrR family transcriptional regulator
MPAPRIRTVPPARKAAAARARASAANPAPADTPYDRILRTAHELFYRDGIRATGIDRVIAESGVAKVTFYRQFASKDALIRAFLEYRHERWMAWFTAALARHGGDARALVPALREWLESAEFRGCAFLNSVGELGGTMPEVVEIARRHKRDMTAAIAALLPASARRARLAQAMALSVDGAIVQAQFSGAAAGSLAALGRVLKALTAPPRSAARAAAA